MSTLFGGGTRQENVQRQTSGSVSLDIESPGYDRVMQELLSCGTLDMHKFLSRKQQSNESLQQFWHALNGLASRCEPGEITQTLVHDVFILNMNNKKVQKKLCVESFNDPQDALKYANSYEEGVK